MMDNNYIIDDETSYNDFLYQKRKQLNIKRKEFAKLLGIGRFRFYLIERGYVKPNKKEIELISKYFDIDFNYYLEGIRSYPTEINDKKKMKITVWLLHIFSKRWFRIFITAFGASLLAAIIALVFVNNRSKISYYDTKVIDVWSGVLDKGSSNISLTDYNYPMITYVIEEDEDHSKAVMIKSFYGSTLSLTFNEIFWYEDYRYYFYYSNYYDNTITYTVSFLNYIDNSTSTIKVEYSNGEYKIKNYLAEDVGPLDKLLEKNDPGVDFENLILSKLGISISFEELVSSMRETDIEFSKVNSWVALALLICFALLLIVIFVALYAFIYGVKKGEILVFNHSDKLLGIEFGHQKVKKDIKFTPFIPEIAVRLLGILLVFFGAFRVVFLSSNVAEYSLDNMKMAEILLSIQMFGMFVIFFVNFDIFMDDERLLRNIILYTMAFLLIYVFETILIQLLEFSNSILSTVSSRLNLPNPFGTAACYFLMILFLFFTPKWVNTKKKLIIYRLMVLVPISFIIVSFIISNFDTFYGTSINNDWAEMFFRGDRFTLSILAMGYLISLFFLRLYFKRKYGEEQSAKIFVGNRFILIKNLMASGWILFIWIFEMIFSGNAKLNSIGIGINRYLILFIPVLLLYHPHKGARKTAVDVAVLSLYVFVLVAVYISAVLVAITSFLDV